MVCILKWTVILSDSVMFLENKHGRLNTLLPYIQYKYVQDFAMYWAELSDL